MAKSAAKKLREKAVREGKRNPECNRSPFAYADMRTRKTKTKKEQLYRSKYKSRYSDENRRDGSFFVLSFQKQPVRLKTSCIFPIIIFPSLLYVSGLRHHQDHKSFYKCLPWMHHIHHFLILCGTPGKGHVHGQMF